MHEQQLVHRIQADLQQLSWSKQTGSSSRKLKTASAVCVFTDVTDEAAVVLSCVQGSMQIELSIICRDLLRQGLVRTNGCGLVSADEAGAVSSAEWAAAVICLQSAPLPG